MLVETIELANELMDQKLCTYAERQSNNKRKADDSFRNNHGHQQQTLKRQNVARRNNGEIPRGNGCFECGATGHFKRDCPKLKNKDGGKVNAPGWVYVVGNARERKCIEGPGFQCRHGNSAPIQKGKRTKKGRLMIHSETTMVINNNPSKCKMSPRSTIWGQAKRSRIVEICLRADMNCIQEGLVPTKYYEKSSQRLSGPNGSRLNINY
uniref:Peptidase_A3 domain-containing protein n=1 Tax=Tanacetum cinerariifolium TaxID=118510 RepID=A0A6L2NLS6_TANCI|nr:peptidase_A3 domain-containing protein [Tanacetum cinerariifolium]